MRLTREADGLKVRPASDDDSVSTFGFVIFFCWLSPESLRK